MTKMRRRRGEREGRGVEEEGQREEEEEEEDLLPASWACGRLPADTVQLDAAEGGVAGEPATAPADEH